jgi:hypothetical protein
MAEYRDSLEHGWTSPFTNSVTSGKWLHFGLEEGSDCLQYSAIIPKIVLFDLGLCPVLVVNSYSFQETPVYKDMEEALLRSSFQTAE